MGLRGGEGFLSPLDLVWVCQWYCSAIVGSFFRLKFLLFRGL